MESTIKGLELLAPAKNFEQGRDALLCGADAIYVGAPRFGARAAAGVGRDDIARLCEQAHRFGARVYVAMNTLLWEEELREAEHIAAEMYDAGADALIVQDMAYLRMDIPSIDLHASTQMCNMTPEGAAFLRDAGFSRVVVERALSLDGIAAIAATRMEVEAFVHGAICVGFSGRCWMSRTTSMRSGNRGECSQSCRLPYNLLDGNFKSLLRGKHLLSPQDMNLTGYLEAMVDAGVSSFKIEGRLKDAAYVRNTVSWYRRELDSLIARRDDLLRTSEGTSEREFEPDLSKTFARGATSYFINGVAGQPYPGRVASFDSPKSQGEYLGRVTAVGGDWFEAGGGHRGGSASRGLGLSSGDGISFMLGDGTVSGTNINRAEGGRVWPNRMDGIVRGMDIYRNYDRLAVTAIENSRLRRVLDASAVVTISAEKIFLKLECGGVSAEASVEGIFDEARDRDKAEVSIRTQISKTGDTVYRITEVRIEGGVRFVSISVLNELRRSAVELLDRERAAAYLRPQRRPERQPPLPTALTAEDNVTNSLAERFYREHGVAEIARGLDLERDLTGRRVMQTRYCLRQELGWCLKNNPAYKDELYLENGSHLYHLRFDCARCGMDIIYVGNKTIK